MVLTISGIHVKTYKYKNSQKPQQLSSTLKFLTEFARFMEFFHHSSLNKGRKQYLSALPHSQVKSDN